MIHPAVDNPPGFKSQESKRALSRTTWAGAVLIGLLQLAVPVVMILWAIYTAFVGAFTTPRPEIEAPAVHDGFPPTTPPTPSSPKTAPKQPTSAA